MKHWEIDGRDLDLKREVNIVGFMTGYAHTIHYDQPKRMIYCFTNDEYLTEEEKAEAIEWVKSWQI